MYSIFQKMRRQKVPLDQVYDLLALRIITDSVKNCYGALGAIHNEWPPIPGRIKDFIAIPRPNMYRSLHTSVIGPGGHAFEVQIRTEEMHRIAEEGIAAHWKYKEGHKGPEADDQRIAWLRQLVEWQGEMQDPGDFLSTLKVDLYPEEVCCFTPRGKVIVLPRDATPIDFAYAIHSDVGHSCVGAKANGRIVPLRYALQNGDVVEILTQAGHMPSKDWLGMVKTSRARNKIKHVVNLNERAKAIEIGVKLLEKEARRLGVSLQRAGKSRTGAGRQRPRMRQDRGPARGARLRPVLREAGAPATRASGRRAARRASETRLRDAPASRPDTLRAGGRPGLEGQGRRGCAGLPRQVLQSDPRRPHRGLHHARQGRRGAFRQLSQRPEPALRSRAQDRRGVDPQRLRRFPREDARPHRRSARGC